MDEERTKKLLALGIEKEHHVQFTPISVDTMYEMFKHKVAFANKQEERLKYYLNEILSEYDHNLIDNPLNFKIDRSDIIKLDGKKFIDNHLKKLEEHNIQLKKLQYRNRKSTKTYGLTVLKSLCDMYGYKIKRKVRSKMVETKRIDTVYYTVIKKE